MLSNHHVLWRFHFHLLFCCECSLGNYRTFKCHNLLGNYNRVLWQICIWSQKVVISTASGNPGLFYSCFGEARCDSFFGFGPKFEFQVTRMDRLGVPLFGSISKVYYLVGPVFSFHSNEVFFFSVRFYTRSICVYTLLYMIHDSGYLWMIIARPFFETQVVRQVVRLSVRIWLRSFEAGLVGSRLSQVRWKQRVELETINQSCNGITI